MTTIDTSTAADAPSMLVEYTNYRGETEHRIIKPMNFWWGKSEWHPKEQWMLTAYDCEKDAQRFFAWQDMRPISNDATSIAITTLRDERDALSAALQKSEARLNCVEADMSQHVCHEDALRQSQAETAAVIARLVAAIDEIRIKAFHQTDIGENHAAGLSGASDRACFFSIKGIATTALAAARAVMS